MAPFIENRKGGLKILSVSTTDFECHAGAVIAGVALKGDFVKIEVQSSRHAVRYSLLDGSRVPEEDVAFFVQQLGASEARRYGCFKRRERQRQFLLGRMLLRFAVSSLLSLPPDVLGFVERTGNAPELVLPDSTSAQPRFQPVP